MTSRGVVAVVVSRNTRDATLACARALLDAAASAKAAGLDVSIVVVDNASSDGTVEAVRQEFGARLDLRAEPRNLGYGAACNRGAARAPLADFIFLLNADVRVAPGAVETLVAALDGDPESMLAGPRIAYPDGRPQPSVRGHPSPAALLYQHTAARWVAYGATDYLAYKRPTPDARSPVPLVMGAAMLVRRAAFDAAGGFDERYFLYFEEADLQRRLAAAGGRVLFVPEATVVHEGSASSRGEADAALLWYLQSLFFYVDRFHGRRAGLGYRAAFKILFLLKLPLDLLRDLSRWLAFGRAGKREEVALTAKFAARRLVPFLLS